MAKNDQRSYFLTYLISSSLTDSEANSLKEEVQQLVKRHKGSVTTTDDWGKKKLAYKIKHGGHWHTEAQYVHLTIELDRSQVVALEKDIYLQGQIMRHLLIVAEDVSSSETAPAVTTAEPEVTAGEAE